MEVPAARIRELKAAYPDYMGYVAALAALHFDDLFKDDFLPVLAEDAERAHKWFLTTLDFSREQLEHYFHRQILNEKDEREARRNLEREAHSRYQYAHFALELATAKRMAE